MHFKSQLQLCQKIEYLLMVFNFVADFNGKSFIMHFYSASFEIYIINHIQENLQQTIYNVHINLHYNKREFPVYFL